MVFLAYSHYSYSSDIVFGSSQVSAYNWVMANILPQQAGLTVDNVFYRYTAVKNTDDDMIVYVQNEDTQGEGYIFRSVDDWSGLPSNTIVKSVPLAQLLGNRFGDGEIVVEGQGTVEDPLVIYSYRYDPCFNPQSDPSCEGYIPAIPEVPTVEDPLDSEYLQDEIDRKAVMLDEEEERQDRERVKEDDSDIDEESLEELLGIAMESALAASDNVVADQLSSMNALPSSYMTALPSTTYNETVTLSDNGAIIKSLVPTNRTRRMSFAQDKLHNELVKSQFKR